MKRSRPGMEVFGLSFLDIVTCAFGAILLLLIVTKPGPVASSAGEENPRLELEIENASDAIEALRALWETARKADPSTSPPPARATAEELKEPLEQAARVLENLEQEKEGLELVRKSLEKTAIAPGGPVQERDPEVGGIPVDSQYVIFIVDTSGSMQVIWEYVVDTLNRILDIHPQVKGFQVMNDNGYYLLESSRRKWIPDTPARRKGIKTLLYNWGAFSSSSPVEGLENALRTYAGKPGKKSIYVLGDDYTGPSYEAVIDTLERMNPENADGSPPFRVHSIGFISPNGRAIYATLMRKVVEMNQGAFLGLPVP
ncbi:MAG: hypothetical protein OXG56_05200 [Gammaproteobacteria bacterium]|nr:hypothetical protein [Gammaproteobacteria bacterium]